MVPNIPFLPGMSAIAETYEAFILDLWGVIHDGVTLYPGVIDCLERIRGLDKTWLMLSNAPRRADETRRSMIALGMPADLCPMVMSSGEAAWRDIAAWKDPFYQGLGRRVLHIGPDRDTHILEGLDIDPVPEVAAADLILNTGPWMDEEKVEDYEDRLQTGAANGVPMICANPDLVVVRGGKKIICAGALAKRYEELGGKVRYFGKPYAPVYDTCLDMLAQEIPGGIRRERILAVGDSLRTDIAGASSAGIDSVLVIGGIHADEFAAANGAPPDPAKLAAACAEIGHRPIASMPAFVWG